MKSLSRLFLSTLILGACNFVFAETDAKVSISEKIAGTKNVCIKVDFDVNDLIEKAKAARENAYCPYSKFKVGAAVLAKSGKIYTGCNVENASYGLTNCAERTAIFKAVSEGERGNFIKAIAIILDAPDYGAPCGTCRQVINEFAESDAVIIMSTMSGKHKIETLATLLPYAFKLEENKN